jgi:hypothetical protein
LAGNELIGKWEIITWTRAGDLGGMFIVDNNYLYHCSADYDGTTDIWRRIAWPGTTW